MDIKISRQSVCLADDMEDHTITLPIGKDTRFSDVFRALIRQKYFPQIAGNDVVWTLFCGDDDVMSWKTKENRLYGRHIGREPAILDRKLWAEAGEVYFKYYSPPVRRAQYIYERSGGKECRIRQEGFGDEYESYHVPLAVETGWRKN